MLNITLSKKITVAGGGGRGEINDYTNYYFSISEENLPFVLLSKMIGIDKVTSAYKSK